MVSEPRLEGGKLIAGVGFSSRAGAGDIAAAVRAVLHDNGLDAARLDVLASLAAKRHCAALAEAADALGVRLMLIGDAALGSAAARGLTHSQLSMKITGLPSASEAAALAAAGRTSRLLAARNRHGPVTCALALQVDAGQPSSPAGGASAE